MTDHLAPIPGSQWQVWRWGLLRSAGFGVDGLDRLSMPACAKAADVLLTQPGTEEDFTAAFDAAVADTGTALRDVAADPRFQQAVIWQNPNVLVAIEGLLRAGPDARRNSRHRSREEIVAKYWQRYCAKNDTVGFFGPLCWVELDPQAPPLTARPGPHLERHRRVFFERWALAAVATALCDSPRIRPWLPVGLAPQLTLDGRAVLHPARGAVPLSAPEAAVVGHCDGVRAAREVIAQVLDDPAAGFRQSEDVSTVIDHLVQREILTWGADLPMDLTAETALRRLLEGVGDPPARDEALAALDRLCARRDAVAAAGDPKALAEAMAALDAEFTTISGLAPRHNAGQTQAGRTLCHLEAVRDVDLTIGGAVLAKLAPLEPLLLSARWLTAELAERYTARLDDLYRDVVAETGSDEVPFERVWYPAVDAFVGRDRPADAVIEEYQRRWTEVLELATVPATTSRLDLPREKLTGRIAAAFPATGPGWAAARIHSPDLHISAPSKEAAERGDVTIVLGELHIGLAAFDTHFFSVGHPAPDEMIAAMGRDVPSSRVALAAPDTWPRLTAREAEWLTGPDDVQLGFAPAPGIDRGRLLPVTSLTVVRDGTGLRARARDGRSWPLIELFTGLIWLHAYDAWKLVSLGSHTPRISVDGLVIARETWRGSVGETGLAGVTGERERYLAVRRWRRELGLPERVFVRVDTEIKPCYFDLTSPLYARVLCAMMTAARTAGGPETGLAVTELLPDSDQAWLPDADGRRYTSELRVQMRDPAIW